jgi:regulator of sigma E protease
MSILIFILILLVLVLVHEFGHFFAAKKFGVRVDEFGFGFPPRLFSWKKGETVYSINALPFGGFVKIFGEDGEEVKTKALPSFPDEGKAFVNIPGNPITRSLSNRPRWQQAIILFAGVLANFLLAWLLLSFGFMSGLPTSQSAEPKGYSLENVRLTVISVLEKSPAEIAGLKSGDKIISVKSGKDSILEPAINPENFKAFVFSRPDKKIEIGYLRGRDPTIFYAEMVPDLIDSRPMIGISMDNIGTAKLPVLRAFWEGLRLDAYLTKSTVAGLFGLIVGGIKGKASLSSIAGPVGIVGIVGDAYKFGLVYLLSFTALISVNLMIINLIPFPALDGGRLLFLLIEKIKGSRMNPKFANVANTVGFAILIIFMLLVTYNDVIKLF